MNEPTIVFYGTPGHPVLEPFYQHVRERGRRRVAFATQGKFPRETGLCLGAGASAPSGWLQLPYEDPIDLDDICGVCLDGYYVDPEALSDLDEADAAYAQTEIWATLIALFARLARRPGCVVANHVTRREWVASRAAQQAFLSACGLRVPRTLITSDPAAARDFHETCGGRTLYKPVTTPFAEFKAMGADDLDRLDELTLAPAHFEEPVDGEIAQCVVVGGQAFTLGASLPESSKRHALEACQRLELTMGEVVFRLGDTPIATTLRTHLSLEALQYAEVLEAATTLLEEGHL